MRSLARLLNVPNKLAMWALVKNLRGQLRLQTASALLRAGVVGQLDEPRSIATLSESAGVAEREMLGHLLSLGARLGLLRQRKGLYSARGALTRLPRG